MSTGTLIIGTGEAGAQTAAWLRQAGYEDPITLVGEERAMPYQRPPLSKYWLQGDLGRSELFLRPDGFWEEANIKVITHRRVSMVDPRAKVAILHTGRVLHWDKLVFATGARVRKLQVPGTGKCGVFYLRTLRDAERLRQVLLPGLRVAVIGGGYIGLEIAATARNLGLEATVLEAEERLLARVAGENLADFFAQYHEKKGVQIYTGAQVTEIEGAHSASGLKLANGEVVPADIVVIGVGVVPNQELAIRAGIACASGNGIIADEHCETDHPGVYAIGDVSLHPSERYGRQVRLESVQNAVEQGKAAAMHIVGKPEPHHVAPFFWSDQFDLRLQIAGLGDGYDKTVVRGSMDEAKFAVFYFKGRELLAVDSVNAPAEYMAARKMIGENVSPDPALLPNMDLSMKEIMQQAVKNQ